jgi:hypothetical protein
MSRARASIRTYCDFDMSLIECQIVLLALAAGQFLMTLDSSSG